MSYLGYKALYIIISSLDLRLIYLRESFCGVAANTVDSDIVENKFELRPRSD